MLTNCQHNAICERALARSSARQAVHACEDTYRVSKQGRYSSCLQVSATATCHTSASAQCPRTCGSCYGTPRIYVYPNEGMERGIRILKKARKLQDTDMPWALDPPADLEHGSYVGPLLYQRMKHYSAPPEQADLFVYFQTPYRPPFHEWTPADKDAILAFGPEDTSYMGNDQRLALQVSCRQWLSNSSALISSLAFLSPETEHRHYMVPHHHIDSCWSEPTLRAALNKGLTNQVRCYI